MFHITFKPTSIKFNYNCIDAPFSLELSYLKSGTLSGFLNCLDFSTYLDANISATKISSMKI